MQYSPGDLVDKFTILLIKLEKGLPVEDEYRAVKEEVDILLVDRKELDDLLGKLHLSNLKQFELEDKIRKFKNDLEGAGETALKIRDLNDNRVKIKNEINKLFDYRFLEHKRY